MTSSSLRRRDVSYRGYEMILEDAERLASGSYETVGNWSFGQILDHLARSFVASIDGVGDRLPFPVRWIGGFFLKGALLNKTLPSGFKVPNKQFTPDETISVDDALQALRAAVHRCTTEKHRSFHPLLGKLDTAEWDRFNLRHAELHMSFVVPINDEVEPTDGEPSSVTTHG